MQGSEGSWEEKLINRFEPQLGLEMTWLDLFGSDFQGCFILFFLTLNAKRFDFRADISSFFSLLSF